MSEIFPESPPTTGRVDVPAPETAPGQAAADEVPEAYVRYLLATFPADLGDFAKHESAMRWKHLTGPREREFWRALDNGAAAQERPAPGAAADRDRYYEALQRIVDAVAAGDAAAVDKLARNALGLTRVGRPGPFQPALELPAAIKAAVVSEVREAASCESDDGDQCRKCNRHADAILGAVGTFRLEGQ